jgi:hypothetical protein
LLVATGIWRSRRGTTREKGVESEPSMEEDGYIIAESEHHSHTCIIDWMGTKFYSGDETLSIRIPDGYPFQPRLGQQKTNQ